MLAKSCASGQGFWFFLPQDRIVLGGNLCYGIYAGVVALGEKKVEVVLGAEYLASQMSTGES